MKVNVRVILIASFITLIPSLFARAATQVPPGFESLVTGQTLWVNLSVYGQSLGLFEASVSLDTVTFLKPEDVAQAVMAHYKKRPQQQHLLDSLVREPLARHGNLACSSNGGAAGCDYLDTDSVALIYDENNANVALFLGPEFIPLAADKSSPYYQQTAETEAAFIHQQNLNFVTNRGDQTLSLQGAGALGLTQNSYAGIDWDYLAQKYRQQNHQEVRFNNVFLRRDVGKRYYVQAGRMDSRDIFSNTGGNITLSQLPLSTIEGVRVGSTLAWMNTSLAAQGTPVTVFITRPSRIDAYRDQQLLGTFYLNAGTQNLDTTAFPNGSYTVTLHVYEDNQLSRTEQVPFSRTGNATSQDIEWFVQGGAIPDREVQGNSADSPNGADRRVMQAGIKVPLTREAALTGGVAMTNRNHFVESALDWSHGFDNPLLDGILATRFSYLKGSEGSRGNIQQLSYNDGFSLSFYRSALYAQDCYSNNGGQYGFSGCYQSSSLMLSVPVKSWYVNAGYSASENEGRNVIPAEPDDSHVVPVWTRRNTYSKTQKTTWQAGIGRGFNVNGININTSANLFTRTNSTGVKRDNGGFLSISFSRVSTPTINARTNYSSLGMTYQTDRSNKDQVGYNVAQNWYFDAQNQKEIGVNLNGNQENTLNASVYGKTGGEYGSGSLAFSSASSGASGQRLSSSGSYNSSMAVARSGLYWGKWGNGLPGAAVGLNVESTDDSRDTRVDVSVDGAGSASLRGTGRTLFSVPAYTQSNISINDSIESDAGMRSEITQGAGRRTLFISPGRMVVNKVNIVSRYTYLGRLMINRQTPLEGVTPLNVTSWSGLGQGGFTAETDHRMKNLYIARGMQMYRCEMKVKSTHDVVRYVGDSDCKTIDLASVPPDVQHQAKMLIATRRSDETPLARAQPSQQEQQ
ncbi:TcfC E-set like domain-containing protein [Ewingella americana]|uniref:Fimbrial protein n=1 Tax=Ewingella americana TaxID=41202 RepID=A0A502GNX3_9GAMM|nr:TcfC E-set like domain-containing protein [Ewingella americana]TPG63128.1 fimbrial protein [Ewingella americana]